MKASTIYTRLLGVLVAAGAVCLLTAGVALAGGAIFGDHGDQNGVVTKIDSGMMFVKPTGSLGPGALSINPRNLLFPPSRAISSRKADRSGLRDAKVGDGVTFVVDEANLVTDLHKTGTPAPARRIISGTLSYAAEEWEEIQLSTPDGPERFAVDPLAGSKLQALGQGTPVILELDDAKTVIDIHRTR